MTQNVLVIPATVTVGKDFPECLPIANGDLKPTAQCTRPEVGEAIAEGAEVLTVEGLANGDELHPMQEAFRQNHGLQCGFCTPGMLMSALDLVKNNPDPSDREVREWLEGNLCRCTGYQNIVKSIIAGAASMRGEHV